MVLARLGPVLAILAGLVAAPAAAQEIVAPDGEAPVVDAIMALEAEILVLVELGAFETVPPELDTVRRTWAEYTDGFTRDELLQWLYEADASGLRALEAMPATATRPGTAVRSALGTIGSADRVVLEAGGTVDIAPAIYVGALETLETMLGIETSAGAGAAGGAPAPVRATRPPSAAESPVGTQPAGPETAASSDYPWASVSLALSGVMLVGAAMVLTGRRRRNADPGNAVVDHLVDAERRLGAASNRDEIAAIAVSEAATLGRARLVAYIDIRSGGPSLAHETAAFVEERRLDAGVLHGVATTGRAVRLVTHREPALRALPAALLAVPVIGVGRVIGILLLVRHETAPFTHSDEEMMVRLTPIVGRALAAVGPRGEVDGTSPVDSRVEPGAGRQFAQELIPSLREV
jgi:hypothetical protein